MKTRILLSVKTALICGMAVFMLYLSGCDITNPLDGIRVILNTKERTSTVSVIFRDSQTREPVGFNEVNQVQITLDGRDRNLLIDLLNRDISGLKPEQGFVSFAIRDDVIPSQSNPVQFVIVARAEGYITTTQPVLINQRGSNNVEIIMVRRENLPQGVSGGTASNIGTAIPATGTTTEILIDSGTLGRDIPATVRIPEGTLLFGAGGEALGGTLASDIFHFNSTDEQSLQSFPGGFSARISNFGDLAAASRQPAALLNTQDESVYFTTGGFLSLDITADGVPVRAFSQPVDISMELDENVFNESGSPVEAGSEVPIWSYDTDTGKWTFESYVQIDAAKNGGLRLTFQVQHLSWWNIDWYGPNCVYGTQVNLLNSNQQLRGKLYRTDVTPNAFLGWAPSRTLPGQPSYIQFLYAPVGIPGRLELYNMADQMLAEVELPDLCSSSPVDVTLNNTTELTINFKGRGLCTDNDDIEVRSNLPVVYRPASGGTWLQAGNLVDGEISISFPAPGIYIFGAWYEGEWYEYELNLTNYKDGDLFEQDIELPQSVCDDL
ncbi:MAG: hypothetical protein JJU35_14215 [Balneolales bacterium]|nr:hypothetical protein [Balneolales bacterium]